MAVPLALQCPSLSRSPRSPSSPVSAAWAAWAPLPAAWPSAKALALPREALLGAEQRPEGPLGPVAWRFPPAWAAAVSLTMEVQEEQEEA